MARRTRVSLNGSESQRMCTCSCADDFRLMMSTFGSLSRPTPGSTGSLVDDVDLAALQRQDLWLHVGEEAELDAIRQRLRTPVIGIADERGADLRRVFLELERPGAVEALLVVALVARRQDDRVVVVGRHACRGNCRSARRDGIRPYGRRPSWCRPSTDMPVNTDSALDELAGSASRSMLATTSSAFISPPLWNFTPLRSLKVHTVPVSFGFQLSASAGCSTRSGPSMHRNSATCCRMTRPPASAMVTGSIAAAGTLLATRMVAPARRRRGRATACAPKPAAAPMRPSSGSDRPSRLPCRMKSRRLTLPSTSPSIRWFSSGERLRRMKSRMR